ncbi:hypothetical protein V5O48_007088 [Marasmius crinis-equi]|uniref:Major facilitator superfamily (MFS) profile domain-containing protein n=1 Tax=Marasmius crinis-equi TaxID=585013 RepID=A0ABR3FI73_9AGAR
MTIQGDKDNEKQEIYTAENVSTPDSPEADQDLLPEAGSPEREAAERRLVRKLDQRMLPTIVIIFIMNYIDRNGITTARLKGLEEDLGLSDLQYQVILSILFVTYCPAQIPSNMVLNYITRPSWYIGGCVVAWGLTSAMTGVTHNFGGILACRVFIGLPEAAFYPGAIYLLSRWYTKKELAFRSAILYAGLLISNAFGALMAAGILSGMEGKLGIRAWRWLFFIEGAITMTIGLLSIWLLPDYEHSAKPTNTRWITGADRRLAQVRLAEDAGEADQDSKGDSPMKGFKMAITDVKVIILAVATVAQLLGLSFVQFFPTLTETLGFSTTISLLLAAPPWIVATILCCLNAWHADRTGERFFHIAGWWWGVIVGFIIALSTMNTAARYVSMFFMACGYVGFSMTLVWVSNIFPRPPAKRAAAIGIVNGTGNLGNLIGAFTWKAEWGPKYHQSMVISLAGLALSSVLALVIRQMVIRENRRLDEDEKAAMDGANRVRVEEAARLEGITFDEAMRRRRGFRYLY